MSCLLSLLGLLQLLDLQLQQADALGEAQDDLYTGEIHAEILDEPPYLLGPSNVVKGVEANPALRPRGNNESLPLV